MNTLTTYDADKVDHSFPYVLVSSLLGALISLTAVWVSAVTNFGPMVGMKKTIANPPGPAQEYGSPKIQILRRTMTRSYAIVSTAVATAAINILVASVIAFTPPVHSGLTEMLNCTF